MVLGRFEMALLGDVLIMEQNKYFACRCLLQFSKYPDALLQQFQVEVNLMI